MQPGKLNNNLIPPSIFRQYDIRGVYGKTLTDATAYLVGKAYGTYLFKKTQKPSLKIAVCRDGRLSSPALSQQLKEGLLSTGLEIVDIGIGPSPMLYYSVFELGLDGGIMLTGSHNPGDYNGFKMMVGTKPLFGDMIQELYQIIQSGDFHQGSGSYTDLFIQSSYIERLIKNLAKGKSLKVAWDAGNGVAGPIVEELIKKLPGEHFPLFTKIDGTFPNHHPDPTVEKNLKTLAQTVMDKKCDVGIAFDGDGDRIGVVDNKGRFLFADRLLAIYATDILKKKPGAKIIFDVKCSQVLGDEIKKHGGIGVMEKTGHSNIKAALHKMGGLLAGEMSGHIFFADQYYGFDDAIYSAVRLINILTTSEKSLSDIIDDMPDAFSTPEIRIHCDDEKKFKIIADLQEKLRQDNIVFSDIDGARISSTDGWWLIRASNTEPALITRAEGYNPDGLQRMVAQISHYLGIFGLKLPAN